MKKDFRKNPNYYVQERDGHLIPVHINKMRSRTHYYNWSSDIGNWIRGEEIPKHMQQMYVNPLPPGKSAYH
jgi:hypothetical protein